MAEHRIGDIIREVFQQRGTGILEIDVDSSTKRRLHFRGGELHLPTVNPLAEQLAAAISNGFPKQEMRGIMRRIATVVGTWSDGVFRFAAGVEDDEEELIGPLPTAELVMAVATLGGDAEDYLGDLGGEEMELVSCPDSRTLAVQIALDPEELLLLSRLDEPSITIFGFN